MLISIYGIHHDPEIYPRALRVPSAEAGGPRHTHPPRGIHPVRARQRCWDPAVNGESRADNSWLFCAVEPAHGRAEA